MCPKNIRDFEIKKILIIGLSCLGDNLLLTPSLKLIKDTFKKADIEIVVGPRAIEFAKENPLFSTYHIYDKRKGILRLVRNLRKKKYDLIIDFRNSLLPFFLRSKFKLTFFLKEFFSDKMFTHESERILKFIEPFFGKIEKIHLYFPVKNSSREKITELFKKWNIKASDIIVVLNPGGNFIPKRWDKKNFISLGKALIKEYEAKIFVVGGEKEKNLTREIKEGIGDERVIDLGGKTTISELAALLEKSDLMVTNDTGPMHLASAVDCPVVAIFGPSNPYRYGPIGVKNYVVHADIDCFPCRVEGKCKIGFECMKRVTVEDVLKAARLILDEKQQQYLFNL